MVLDRARVICRSLDELGCISWSHLPIGGESVVDVSEELDGCLSEFVVKVQQLGLGDGLPGSFVGIQSFVLEVELVKSHPVVDGLDLLIVPLQDDVLWAALEHFASLCQHFEESKVGRELGLVVPLDTVSVCDLVGDGDPH